MNGVRTAGAPALRVVAIAVAAIAMVATTVLLIGTTQGTAAASACDATVSDEAELLAAVTCYDSELDGSETVVTMSADIALTDTLFVNNPTTATLTIDGAGNTLTGVFDDMFSDDGIAVQAGHLIFTELVYNAQSNNGVGLSPNTSLVITNSVLDAIEPIDSMVAAGQTGTVVSLTNSSIGGGFLTGISAEGTVMLVDSTIAGRSGIRTFAGSNLTVTNSTLFRPAAEFPGAALEIEGMAQLVGVTIKDFQTAIQGIGSVSLEGTLIANIGGAKCDGALTVINAGGNTVPDDSCGDIVGTEFQSLAALGLGPLQDNGCAASLVSCPQTVAISGIDSPAIDAWPGCTLLVDQRGSARTANACDSGAYEGFDCPGPVATAEQFELGIECYNRAGTGQTTTLELTADITLTQTLLSIDNDTSAILIIDGDGHSVTTLDGEIGFNLLDGDLRFRDLTVAGASTIAVRAQGATNVSLVESTIVGSDLAITGLGHSGEVSLLRSELDGNDIGIIAVFDATIDASTVTGSATRGLVTGTGTTTITNSTFAENDFAFQVQDGTTTVTNTTFARNSPTAIGMVSVAAGTVTFVDSMSFNENGACGTLDPSRTIDGGGNVMADDCGPIAGIDQNPGDPDWLALLPALALNPCEPGVACTRTVATPAGFPTAGAARTCGLPTDQRGVARIVASCDAGAFEIANQTPVAVDDLVPGFDLDEDDPATVIDVLVNDTDPDPGDTLVVQSTTQPGAGGVASIDNGQLVFTPSAEFSGSAQFTYTVADDSGATDVASVLVQIAAVNDPPVPVDDNIFVPKNGFERTEPAANDSDIEGSALTVATITQPPTGEGTAALVDNRFVDYTPPIGFVGMTSFTYSVQDDGGATAIGTILVEVTGVNAPPVADPDSGEAIQNGDPILIAVLANDSDEDGDDLSVVSVTQPPNGRAVLIGNDVQYTPDADFIGEDTFTYAVGDGRGGSATGVVTVTVAMPPLCNGLLVTIDLRFNGGNGLGTAGDDVIMGTAGDDIIDGGDGDDTVCAGSGDDQVVGGNGDDTLFGEDGRDILRGNTGQDLVDGGDGRDRLLGGTGDDTIIGGEGNDFIGGFGGADTIDGGNGDETIFGGFGPDIIDGGPGADSIFGLIGNDIINGGSGDDLLNGDRGNDVINGGTGNDTINGGNANDELNGQAGDDNISGGKADDVLSGGTGSDVCVGNLQTVADTTDGTCEQLFGVP